MNQEPVDPKNQLQELQRHRSDILKHVERVCQTTRECTYINGKVVCYDIAKPYNCIVAKQMLTEVDQEISRLNR